MKHLIYITILLSIGCGSENIGTTSTNLYIDDGVSQDQINSIFSAATECQTKSGMKFGVASDPTVPNTIAFYSGDQDKINNLRECILQ